MFENLLAASEFFYFNDYWNFNILCISYDKYLIAISDTVFERTHVVSPTEIWFVLKKLNDF
jgi:hypothetical protein